MNLEANSYISPGKRAAGKSEKDASVMFALRNAVLFVSSEIGF